MLRSFSTLTTCLLLTSTGSIRADAFDRYTNPVLTKAVSTAEVKELKKLTPDFIADNDRVLTGSSGAFLIVKTNEGRYCKLLVQAARQKVEGSAALPILLIERYATYREGQERALQTSGQNICLFDGFRLNLDIGQVVPAALGADLRFVAQGENIYAEPIGKAQLYIVTKALAEAAPKKTAKLVIGETFEPRYFNGSYKLHDDGRRSGTLTLQVAQDGEVTGSYTSDKDGRKYDVEGKIANVKHSIQFSVKFPQSRQSYQGWLFTANGKVLTGYSRLQEREAGFYAIRMEEE